MWCPISTCCLMCSYSSSESLSGLAEHAVVDADLADVVQQARQIQGVDRLGVAAEFLGQADGHAGHAVAVAAGVRVLGVDGGSQRPDDRRQQFRLLPVQLDVAAVDAEDRGDRAQQARFDRAELAVVDVVQRRQPAEDVARLRPAPRRSSGEPAGKASRAAR